MYYGSEFYSISTYIYVLWDQNSTVYKCILCIMDQNSTVYQRIFMYYGIGILQYMNVYLCIMGSEFYSI